MEKFLTAFEIWLRDSEVVEGWNAIDGEPGVYGLDVEGSTIFVKVEAA